MELLLGNFRIGLGFDVHQIAKIKRPLILGGTVIPAPFGLDAVSDGDVVLHTIADAICGPCLLGDIGDHFPPEDKKNKGIDSKKIVRFILGKIKKNYTIVNIDTTIIAEKPRLAEHKDRITKSLARIFKTKRVNVKIKSKEGLDILGGKNAISCMAVVLVKRK